MPIHKKNKVVLNRIIQLLIIAGIALFVYFKLNQDEVSLNLEVIKESFNDDLALWILILLLMPVNWLLESIKWKILSAPVARISLKIAALGVLSGLSFSFITPHGWGDYFGRIMVLKNTDRGKLVGALFFGKMAQLFITIVAGVFGLLMYLEKWPFLYIWYFIILVLLAILIAFNKSLYKMVKPYLFKVRYYFRIIKSYSAKRILSVTGISLVRYLVFTMQFILILIVLNVDLPMVILLSGVTWVFLIKSIIPSFNFLSDLGIREVSALMFFESYITDVGPVLSATFIIWIINILLPSLIGTFFIFYIKVIR